MFNEELNKIINRGNNIHCESGFSIFNGEKNIYLGSNIYLVDTLINAGDDLGSVRIDDYVFFGHGVKILARGHDYKEFNLERQIKIVEKPIHIQEGAWVSSGSIILGGVTIGKNAVVGAGSVVTKNIQNNAIYAGNPAKIIRYIHRELTMIEKFKRFFQ